MRRWAFAAASVAARRTLSTNVIRRMRLSVPPPVMSTNGLRFLQTQPLTPSAPSGIVQVTEKNFNSEIKSAVPILLYFHVLSHPEVAKFTKSLMQQVAQSNRSFVAEAELFGGVGPEKGMAIKLLMVDCDKERALAANFGISAERFPLIQFLWNLMTVDKLVGIVPEANIVEVIANFIKYGVDQVQSKKDGTDVVSKFQKSSPDEENVMTLIQAAIQKLKENEYGKALTLFEKAITSAEVHIVQLKSKLGLDKKKMTPEMLQKLKVDPQYLGLPQALAGRALTLVSLKRWDEAVAQVVKIREDHAWAVRDLRDVAEAVVRIELVGITNFDLEKDNYGTLLKKEEFIGDIGTFYVNQVKLATFHWLEKSPDKAIDECLRIIRMEPKILQQLKVAGVVSPECSLKANNSTPARKVLFLFFEALGNSHELVVAARKKMSAFMFA